MQNLVIPIDRGQTTVPDFRYAPWNLAELFLREGRRRRAVRLLSSFGAFPTEKSEVLEVGVGRLGWLPDLVGWGVPPDHLHGIDLSAERIEAAKRLFPSADLQVGDASDLPWTNGRFDLVVASTLLTSVLDDSVRCSIAAEITRVLKPGAALLIFDFVVNSPRNNRVRKLTKRDARTLFGMLQGSFYSACLAPPIARVLAPRMHWLATMLECLPFLRTHMVGVLIKPGDRSRESLECSADVRSAYS